MSKWTLFLAAFLISLLSVKAQSVTGERVLIKECGRFTVMFVNEKKPFDKSTEAQLIKQLGKSEYLQVKKLAATANWPSSIKDAFDCENLDERNRLVMYKVATYKTKDDYHGAIVKIPYTDNKDWKKGVVWNGSVYLDIPAEDIIPYKKEQAVAKTNNTERGKYLFDYDCPEGNCFVYVPAAGDKLVYGVTDAYSNEYEFIVTLKEYKNATHSDYEKTPYPIAFAWEMQPQGTKGEVAISRNSLENAKDYVNYFKNGSSLKLDRESTVFLSGKNYYEPDDTNNYSTLMNLGAIETNMYLIDKPRTISVRCGNDRINIPVKTFNSAKDGTDDYELLVQDNGLNRLIILMNLDFEIVLKEIIPAL